MAESTRPPIVGVIESALYVDDMQRSVAFYRDLFGFPVLTATERLTALRAAPRQMLLIFQRGASAQPSVMPFGTIPPSDGAGTQHVAFGIASSQLASWKTRLGAHGVSIESSLGWPDGGESIYFRDPDGHSIELKTSDWDGTPLEDSRT